MTSKVQESGEFGVLCVLLSWRTACDFARVLQNKKKNIKNLKPHFPSNMKRYSVVYREGYIMSTEASHWTASMVLGFRNQNTC